MSESQLKVVDSTPGIPLAGQATTLGKLFNVHTHVPLSLNSRNWYQSKYCEGNDSIWERCGLAPI